MSEPAPDGVTVTGTGHVPVPPDLLVVRCGVEVTAQSVRTALERGSTALAAMVAVFRDAGVPGPDRQTDHAAVNQSYDHQGHPRGWAAVQALTVRLRELSRAGELIGAAVAAGGDAARLFSVSFDVDDTTASWETARGRARRHAFADARARAEQYADLAGRRLGEVSAVREHDRSEIIRPVSGLMPVAASTIPVEQGELSARCLVEVRWKLIG